MLIIYLKNKKECEECNTKLLILNTTWNNNYVDILNWSIDLRSKHSASSAYLTLCYYVPFVSSPVVD